MRKILNLELMLADLDQITRRLERVEKDLKKKKETDLEFEQAVLFRCKKALEATQALREIEFTTAERKKLTGFMFLSQRPILYVLNVGDEEVAELDAAIEKTRFECAFQPAQYCRGAQSADALKRSCRTG